MNFKVGDIVECIEAESDYVQPGAIGKITNFSENNRVRCDWTSGDYLGNRNGAMDWYIDTDKIKLAKPRLDTLIKRIKLGQKAQKEMIEHYNDEIKVTEYLIEFYPAGLFTMGELEFTKIEVNND